MGIHLTLGIVSALLFSSFLTNLVLFRLYLRKPKRQQSLELREFLGDLLSGPAIVAVGRMDPNSILLRSPKQK